MACELRLDGQRLGRFDTALAGIRRLLASRPDREPAFIDLETGEPLAPGATRTDRAAPAKDIGS